MGDNNDNEWKRWSVPDIDMSEAPHEPDHEERPVSTEWL